MSLRDDISGWDGKATAPMEAVHAREGGSRGFGSRLVSLFEHAECERGATWLLKRRMESGAAPLSPEATAALIRQASSFERWESRLHVLQCFGWLRIPGPSAVDAEAFLESCLDGANTFVRAWAYSGYAELARQHPRYREEAEALLADAMEHEEKASVRARVRKVLKAGF